MSILPGVMGRQEGRAEFVLMEWAWASLRREGWERFRKVQLVQRIETIKWVLKHLGLPIGPWAVEMSRLRARSPTTHSGA